MIVDYRNRYVFLANPKTGSTAIESALGSMPYTGRLGGHPKLKHTNFRNFLKIREGLDLQGYPTICVVRHPVEKFISWFSYRSRPEIEGEPGYLGDKTLREHIRTISRKEIMRCINEGFVTAGESCVDIMFKYEHFGEVLTFFNALNPGIEEIPNVNVSRRSDGVTEQEVAMIRDLLAPSIDWYERLEDMDSSKAMRIYRSSARTAA